MSKAKKDKEQTVTPITIIDDWQQRIEPHLVYHPADKEIICRFIQITYPYPLFNKLEDLIKLYVKFAVKTSDQITVNATLQRFLRWHHSQIDITQLGEPTNHAHTYPIQKAFMTLDHADFCANGEVVTKELAKFLVDMVACANFHDPLFNPERLYEHMCSFRLASLGILGSELRKQVLNKGSLRDGLETLQSYMKEIYEFHVLAPEEKAHLEPPALASNIKVRDTLGGHYFNFIGLIDHDIELGTGKRESRSHETSSNQREVNTDGTALQNTLHHRIQEQINRPHTRNETQDIKHEEQTGEKIQRLFDLEDATLEDEISKLANGDETSKLTRLPILRDMLGASTNCIRYTIKNLNNGFARSNNPHPTQNAIYTVSELLSYWQAIVELGTEHIDMALLANELLLIMFTDIAPHRFEHHSNESIDDEQTEYMAMSRIYITDNNVLCYLLAPKRLSNNPNNKEKICLAINPKLAQALCNSMHQAGVSKAFTDINQRYARAKTLLRKINLPRNISQWGYAAREILRTTLSDFELDIIRGDFHFRNWVEHQYCTTIIQRLNERYTQAINLFISNLTNQWCELLPLEPFNLDPNKFTNATNIGSQKAAQWESIKTLLAKLHSSASHQNALIKSAQTNQKVTLQPILKVLQSMAINRAFLNNLAASGRWHQNRTIQIRTTNGFRIEDKDSKHFIEPRSCGNGSKDGHLLHLIDQQNQNIYQALAHLDELHPGLTIDWPSISEHLQHSAYCFSIITTSNGLNISAKPLNQELLTFWLGKLGIKTEPFALNTLRHWVITEGLPIQHRTILSEQTGHKMAGLDHLAPLSSASFKSLHQQSQLLDKLAQKLECQCIQLDVTEVITHARQKTA